MANRWHFLLGVALGSTVTCAVLICLAMGTDEWVKYNVDRRSLTEDLRDEADLGLYNQLFTHKIYWNRHRGLYRMCYTDSTYAERFPERGKMNGDTVCYSEDGYDFDSADNLTYIEGDESAKGDYETRNHLLRAVTATFVFSLVTNLIAFCAAIIATCREQIKGLKIATFVSFLAALFCISAMVMFHVVHEMETNTIRLEQFKAGWSSMENHKHLVIHTDISFGYSYMIGWVAAGLNFFAVLFYLFSIFSLSEYINELPTMATMRGDAVYPHYAGKMRPSSSASPSDPYAHKRRSAADELYYASNTRNQAYNIVGDYRRITRADKPGQDEEINRQIKPVRREQGRNSRYSHLDDEEPGSWYARSLQSADDQPRPDYDVSRTSGHGEYGNRY